jgi:hypothetical protein
VELRDNLFGTVSGSFHVIRVPGGASRHPDSHNTWNNLRGAPQSVQFSSFRDYDLSLGWYWVYFTTTDDSTTQFPLYYTSGSNFAVSEELRQVNQSSVFETDYAVWSETYAVWVQYGRMSLYLPVNDANENTIPDWMERAQPGNETAVTGTYTIDWPSPGSYSPYAVFTRNAGSLTGNYSLKIGSGPTTFGTWTVNHVNGNVTYNRTSGTMSISASINDGPVYSGTATLTLQNHDQATLGQFTLSRAGIASRRAAQQS